MWEAVGCERYEARAFRFDRGVGSLAGVCFLRDWVRRKSVCVECCVCSAVALALRVFRAVRYRCLVEGGDCQRFFYLCCSFFFTWRSPSVLKPLRR